MELRTLRIDSRTTILVPPHKCNEQYAEMYRDRMWKNPNIIRKTNDPTIEFSDEQIQDIIRMHDSRRTYRYIAKKYNVSDTTIRRLVKEQSNR